MIDCTFCKFDPCQCDDYTDECFNECLDCLMRK